MSVINHVFERNRAGNLVYLTTDVLDTAETEGGTEINHIELISSV